MTMQEWPAMQFTMMGRQIPLAKGQSITIICGSDPDGALTAGMFAKLLLDAGVKEDRMVLVFERFLPVRTWPTGSLVLIGDLPLDNQHVQQAKNQLIQEQAGIALLVGHHRGDEMVVEILGERAMIDMSAPSCPTVMKVAGAEVTDWAIRAANWLDAPQGGSIQTPIAHLIRSAYDMALIKFMKGDRAILVRTLDTIATLVSHEHLERSAHALSNLADLAIEFEPIVEEMIALIKSVQIGRSTVANGVRVALLQADKNMSSPVTELGNRLYELGYQIVVLQAWEGDEPVTTVMHNLGRPLNLLEVFGLESGATFRVPLKGEHEPALAMVTQRLGLEFVQAGKVAE